MSVTKTNSHRSPSIGADGPLGGMAVYSTASAARLSQRIRRDRTALVLAGGGILGSVYEIGALRAIDDMLVDRTVNDFDIYVGTSAGALVNALVASSFTPREIMQAIDNRHPEIQGFRVGDLFRTNVEGLVRRLRKAPGVLWRVGSQSLTHLTDLAVSDIVWEFTQMLPSGLYNGDALEHYIRLILEEKGRPNRFDQLQKELYIVATELETGERAVFGQGGKSVVPISQAVAASSAVPLLYRPVRIFDRDYLDGGLHGSASLDLAIEAGAKLVVCINPMVPFNSTAMAQPHYIRERGVQAIINQTVRTLLHAGVRYHIKNLRVKYPDVDIILIQPDWHDHRMFSHNPMYYGSRLSLAEHGFESVAEGLMANFEYYQNILSRHGIRLTTDLVSEQLSELRVSHDDPKVVRHIIERSGENPSLMHDLRTLEATLVQLDAAMETPQR